MHLNPVTSKGESDMTKKNLQVLNCPTKSKVVTPQVKALDKYILILGQDAKNMESTHPRQVILSVGQV